MIRKAQFCGGFYDADPQKLKKQFDKWFESISLPEIKGKITGVIVPHAGYMYSGYCAAYAYKLLRDMDIDTAIIIHPSHRTNHFDFSISPYTQYQTPLGDLLTDEALAERISASGARDVDKWYHQNEHSMEVQLPFLKYIKPDIRIVTVMIGRQTNEVSRALASDLFHVFSSYPAKVVLIISTDMSHYHSRTVAAQLDRQFIRHLVSENSDALYRDINAGKIEACGFAGVLTMMHLAKLTGNTGFTELAYTDSADESGDTAQVVGYLAAAMVTG